MEPGPTGHEAELEKLAATRTTVARSRFARAMSGPWRVAMWVIGLLTAASLGSALFFMFTGQGTAILLLALVGVALVSLTALGMIATFYPGPIDELEKAVEGGSRELEQQVAGVKTRLDLATSKGNRERGPYGAGGGSLDQADVEATREEVEASLAELERVRRRVEQD